MEDRLEPCVHYFPLAQDFSDLQEKALWCLANLDKCEAIGIAGRCFIRQFMDEHVEDAVQYAVLEPMIAQLESSSNKDMVCQACIPQV